MFPGESIIGVTARQTVTYHIVRVLFEGSVSVSYSDEGQAGIKRVREMDLAYVSRGVTL